MNVLISGGAGFIGSWLTEKLRGYGNRVTIIDDMSTGKYSNVPDGVKVIHTDVVDRVYGLHGYDYVIHLASPASPDDFKKQPINILDVNTQGTKNLLEIAKSNNAKFLFASTSEIYGDPHPEAFPIKESYWGNVNPVGIRGCYDVGKRAGEAYCMAYQRTYGMDVRIARIFNTYGERMPDDGRVMINFIKQATSGKPLTIYGDGTQTRSFTHVSDLVDGLITMMSSVPLSGYPINLGSRHEVRIKDLAERIAIYCDVDFNVIYKDLPEDDPKRRIPDTTRAIKYLNWQPKVSLENGLQRTIRWWKNDCKNR